MVTFPTKTTYGNISPINRYQYHSPVNLPRFWTCWAVTAFVYSSAAHQSGLLPCSWSCNVTELEALRSMWIRSSRCGESLVTWSPNNRIMRHSQWWSKWKATKCQHASRLGPKQVAFAKWLVKSKWYQHSVAKKNRQQKLNFRINSWPTWVCLKRGHPPNNKQILGTLFSRPLDLLSFLHKLLGTKPIPIGSNCGSNELPAARIQHWQDATFFCEGTHELRYINLHCKTIKFQN